MEEKTKFRGKSFEKWIIGDLIFIDKKPFIYLDEMPKTFIGKFFPVHPDSVGQYTGIIAKDEIEICEGDKVKFHQFLFDGDEHEETGTGIIEQGEYGWMLTNIIHDGMGEYMGYTKQDQLDGKVETYLINVYGLHEESFEVIGNCFDDVTQARQRREKFNLKFI